MVLQHPSSGGWHCCLGAAAQSWSDDEPGANNTSTKRFALTIRPVRVHHHATNTSANRTEPRDDLRSMKCSASNIEENIESLLHFPDNDESNTTTGSSNDEDSSSDNDDIELLHDPVQILPSEDGHLLKCRRPKNKPRVGNESAVVCPTILGIEENISLYNKNNNITDTTSGKNTVVDVTVNRPTMPSSDTDDEIEGGCCCDHPMGNWDGRRDGAIGARDDQQSNSHESLQHRPHLRIVDLTKLQQQRRCTSSSSSISPSPIKPIMNGPGNVCHLLRSVLTCSGASSHCASPWSGRYVDSKSECQQQQQPLCRGRDETIALLLLGHQAKTGTGEHDATSSEWDMIERLELSDILKFRTGDASPSYYLHSVSQLSMSLSAKNNNGDSSADIDLSALLGSSVAKGANHENEGVVAVTMLVYRHLPPRDTLSLSHPIDGTGAENSEDPYYLWETFQPPPPKPEEEADSRAIKVQEDEPPPVQYRLVAPPYQSHKDLYPGLFDEIMKPESIRAIVEEALNIPQWTAWPEKNHYSSPDDDNEDDAGDKEQSPYPATWTVFPLCHTFPADVVANRKWIDKTCGFVPRTTALLKGLGPTLRTALFSRLEPRTTLSAHTGWADLANHVLRIHIPLVVPEGTQNLGLCGTWVDGCVETHRMDDVVCFDDSKVHRAFNYTNEERIVLIVDLARPDSLPAGTAVGGHTEELDKFIKELT